jgi:hypothetical protein
MDAKDRKDAATAAGLKDRSVRDALKKPTSPLTSMPRWPPGGFRPAPRTFDHLDNIAATSKNDVARVAAIKTMEQIDVAAVAPGRQAGQQLPGLRIAIVTVPNTAPRVIGPEPATIDHE